MDSIGVIKDYYDRYGVTIYKGDKTRLANDFHKPLSDYYSRDH